MKKDKITKYCKLIRIIFFGSFPILAVIMFALPHGRLLGCVYAFIEIISLSLLIWLDVSKNKQNTRNNNN